MLNIAIFASSPVLPPWTGTQRVIYESAIELAKRNHVVVVSLSTNLRGRFKLNKRNGVIFIEVPLRSPFQQLLTFFRFFIYKAFPSFRFTLYWLHEIFFKWCRRDFIRLLGTDYDILLCEDLHLFPLLLHIKQRPQTRVVYRVHIVRAIANTNEEPSFRKGITYFIPLIFKITTIFERRALKASDLVLTLSTNDSSVISKIYGITSETIGIGAHRNNIQTDHSIPKIFDLKPGQYMLYVSSYSLMRGSNTVLKLAKELPQYDIALIGKASFSKASSIPSNIKKVGVVSDKTLYALYSQAKLVLVPLTWAHGLGVPVKLVEALAQGKAVIASTQVASTLEKLKHKHNIYIFNNFFEIVEGVKRIFKDQEFERKLANEAVQYARENLSWTKKGSDLENTLKKLSSSLE